MFELVKKYLKDNGITDFTLFSLGKEGQGTFIKSWGYDIAEPEFTPEETLLAEAQASKLTQLESARKEFQYRNIELGNVTYVASKIACDNLCGTIDVMLDNGLTQTNWLDADNESITLTLIAARELRTAMLNQQSTAYFQEITFKDAINSCNTVEEVLAIDISF